ncbi:hypothetical protein SDJN03_27377, partial [Cucurbita argyrosperma subsp. sororia]
MSIYIIQYGFVTVGWPIGYGRYFVSPSPMAIFFVTMEVVMVRAAAPRPPPATEKTTTTVLLLLVAMTFSHMAKHPGWYCVVFVGLVSSSSDHIEPLHH